MSSQPPATDTPSREECIRGAGRVLAMAVLRIEQERANDSVAAAA